MTDKASDDLVERIAETIWLAEYLRATEKRRSIDWSEVADHDKNKYRFLANEISNGPLTPLRAQLAAAEAYKYALNCSYDAAQERLKVTFKRALAAEAQLASAMKALGEIRFYPWIGEKDWIAVRSIATEAHRSLKPDGGGK